MKSRRLGVLFVSMLTLCVAWPAHAGYKQQVGEKVRIGYLPLASSTSFFVALDQGFFRKRGLVVEPIRFESSNQALQALVMDRIDATSIVALEAALTLEANTPGLFKIIEMTAATEYTKVHRIVVKPDSSIRKLADLKGKTIGTFPGSQMVVFLKLILGRFFDAEKDVRIVQLKPELQPQALVTGQVDALFCLEPTGSMLEERHLARAISINPLYEYIQKPFPTSVGLVSNKLITQNPTVVYKIIDALRDAHKYIQKYPEDVRVKVLPKYTPIETALAPAVSLYDYWTTDRIDRKAVQKLINLYVTREILTKPVDAGTLIFKDSRYQK